MKRVIVIAILGALPGLQKAANEWPEGVEIWVAGVDGEREGKTGRIPEAEFGMAALGSVPQ